MRRVDIRAEAVGGGTCGACVGGWWMYVRVLAHGHDKRGFYRYAHWRDRRIVGGCPQLFPPSLLAPK